MILQKRDQHTRRRHDRIVQGMGKIFPAVLAVNADFQAARLRIAERRAGTDFEVFLLARGPCLHVKRLHFQVGKVAGTTFQRPHRDIHRTEKVNRILPELIEPVHAVLRFADDNHFLFLELMNPVDAALLKTVRAFLLAETGRITRQRQRKRILR